MEMGETRDGRGTEVSTSPTWRERLGLDIDPLWFLSCLIAAGFFSVAAVLPLWSMRLTAPQYPAGLVITAYGTRMIGDLSEVNSLNHYIGAMVIQPESISELVLFPYALGAIIGALLLASVVRCPPALRLLLSIGVWSFPFGLLADLQWWLYRFGHELASDAPMRALVPDGFTPRVLGHTHVVNFDTITGVQWGFWMMVAGALTPGVPWVLRFLRDSWRNTGTSAAALLLVIALALVRPGTAVAAPTASIAHMIESAAPGATVVVPSGTYRERLVIDKPLTLVGEGKPVIDGGGEEGDVILVTAADVTVRGFVVQGSGRDVSVEPAGIRVRGDRATIDGNIVRDALYGIVLEDSGGHRVRDNVVSSIESFSAERRGHALYLWHTDGNEVTGNTVTTAKDGIFLGFASHNRIDGNRVSGARYGIHYMYADHNSFAGNSFQHSAAGAAIMFSRDITFRDNEFAYNRSAASGYGLLFKDVDDVEMTGNRVHHNRLGITLEGAPITPSAHITLQRNLIGFNDTALSVSTTTAVVFTENTFVGNLEQVAVTGGSVEHHNTWAVDGRGNYWDEYRGFDARGDGVGDIPFRYEGTFDELTRRNEWVRLYSFTPARGALDLAARWFPAYRPEPRVVDTHPLMTPRDVLRATDVPADGWMTGAVGLGLVLLALGAFRAVSGGSRRGWA